MAYHVRSKCIEMVSDHGVMDPMLSFVRVPVVNQWPTMVNYGRNYSFDYFTDFGKGPCVKRPALSAADFLNRSQIVLFSLFFFFLTTNTNQRGHWASQV